MTIGIKKVLFIIDSHNVGGVEKRFSYLFNYLASKASQDEKVIFWVNIELKNKINTYQSYIRNNRVKIHFFGLNLPGKTIIHKSIARLFEFLNIIYLKITTKDIFNLICFVTSKSRKYRKFFNAPKKMVVIYGSISSGKRIYKALYNELISKNYIIDCLSQNITNTIISTIDKQSAMVYTSPNSFIDYTNTECLFYEKQDVISFAGRFTEAKGVFLLLDTIKYVLKRNSNLRFLILGYGKLEENIKNFIKNNDLTSKVSVFYTSEPKTFLKQSKVFLSLQLIENYPSQSLIEAMACKNFIIATDVGLTYKLVNKHSGKRVNSDPILVGKAIIESFNDQAMLEEKGKFAREYVMKIHTVENYYKYIKSFLYI